MAAGIGLIRQGHKTALNSTTHTGKVNELTFQNDMLKHLLTNGWLLGKAENYNLEPALYPQQSRTKSF